ncbi:uncharacterized protein LOC117592468 [Drosophila guanche]|uniref:Protein lifeguard 1 n=1 Tax=Drosophila guanche TaxID=7266 RepID=A0A3B0J3Y0_DROGU|nr:uncharacterized protein LOC117592468 [Drosophila guanche]SPP74083.1 Hypothetical predicted protein [Drosophila guanche]
MERRATRLRTYQRDRRKFACICYTLTLSWLLLALLQWLLISVIAQLTVVFIEYYWISLIFFVVAMVLVSIFVFYERVRAITGLNWLMCLLIVEFVIIGVFNLAALSHWQELLVWCFSCMLLLFVFVLIGSIIPHDLTLDVVILFVLAFIFLIVTVWFAMISILVKVPYSFVVYQLCIAIVVLLFVMYHAQTINGGRFAEMRLNDYLLAALILFHDFTILFLLTFYQQLVLRFIAGATTTARPVSQDIRGMGYFDPIIGPVEQDYVDDDDNNSTAAVQ